MLVTRARMMEFFSRLDARFARPGRVYLVGETTQVVEGWRNWSARIEIFSAIDEPERAAFTETLDRLKAEMAIEVVDESPGDVIPLPEGYETRMRPAEVDSPGCLEFLHFDPYSVSLRFIARGDEPDYHLVLGYLRREWISVERMDEILERTLPRFTERTIQQDPAEFRRKYHGLLQMWRADRSSRTSFAPQSR